MSDRAPAAPAQFTRKPHGAVDAVLLNRRIGPLQQRIYNVMLGWCQALVAREVEARASALPTVFTLPLSSIMALCDYGSSQSSHNTAHFEESAKGLLDFHAIFNGLSDGVLADDGRIVPTPAPKPKRGRRGDDAGERSYVQLVAALTFRWPDDELVVEYPRAIVALLLRPDAYCEVPWWTQGRLGSRAAMALYELVLRHEGEGETPMRDWRIYSRVLTGDTEPHTSYREFGKVMRRALDAVNEQVGTHEVAARVLKRGRSFDRMQFRVRRLERGGRPGESLPQDLVDKLVGFGMARMQAHRVCRTYPRAMIEANFDYAVQWRQQGKLRGRDNPGGFLNAAITRDFAGSARREASPATMRPTAPPPVVGSTVPARTEADETRRLVSLLLSLPPEVGQQLLAQCVEESPPPLRAVLPRDLSAVRLDDPRVIGLIGSWLAKRGAGRPAAA